MSELTVRDLKNDAEWLRTIADGADILPDHGYDAAEWAGNLWLWPETRDNLKDMADALEEYERQRTELRELCDEAEARMKGNPFVPSLTPDEVRQCMGWTQEGEHGC